MRRQRLLPWASASWAAAQRGWIASSSSAAAEPWPPFGLREAVPLGSTLQRGPPLRTGSEATVRSIVVAAAAAAYMLPRRRDYLVSTYQIHQPG